MKLPIYMNQKNQTTIEVKWWGILYLKVKYFINKIKG